jgi:VWFA-related protein
MFSEQNYARIRMLPAAQLLSGGKHLLYGMARKTKIGSSTHRALRGAAAIALLACGAALASAWPRQSSVTPPPPAPQSQPAPPAQSEQGPAILRVRTQEVLVPVLVRNRSGDPVLNLVQKDFRLFEDNVEQKINFFSKDPFPLSVVFLVDDELPQGTAEMVGRSLSAVLGGMAQGDEMAVVLFAEFPRTVADFGASQDKLYKVLKNTALENYFPGSASPTMTMPPNPTTSSQEIGVPQSARVIGRESKDLDDAVLYCANMLHDRPRDRRKLLLIVSDGRNSHNNTASYGQAVRALLSSDVSVYGIGVSQAVLDRKRAAIARYVDATGGDIFYAARRNSLEEDYSHILEESRNRYTLAYSPSGTDRSKEYHEIEVRVERPGLEVTARNGYYVLVTKK